MNTVLLEHGISSFTDGGHYFIWENEFKFGSYLKEN